MPKRLLIMLSLIGLGLSTGCQAPSPGRRAELKVSSDFPGGSALVESLDQTNRVLQITPASNPGKGWEAWWYFKLEGVRPGETITLDVGRGVWATPDQAMFSYDNRHWQHTAPGRRVKDRITFQHTVTQSTVWFAWGPPFVLSDAQQLIADMQRQLKSATPFVLATSREGRAVPAIRIQESTLPEKRRLGIWVQARQHAWESGASWVGKGFAEWIVSNDPQARELRQKADIYFVPIMDVDNVERGAGGKNQSPHDHNRDWSERPIFPEVAAAQKYIQELDKAGRFDLFVDLHNPAPNDKQPFYFVTIGDYLSLKGRKNLQDFFAISREQIHGPLPLADKMRESGPAYDKDWQMISKNWVTKQTSPQVVALTLETSWNTPQSTPAGYLKVGEQLGRVMEKYFEQERR
jgi:hypothetical protein